MKKNFVIIIWALVFVCVVFGAYSFLVPGSVQITSTPPGARVLMDGKDTGQITPCLLKGVRPGKHTIELQADGYHEIRSVVSVKGLTQASLMPELRKRLTTGFVQITSTPTDVEVRIDGKSTGLRTPITLDEIKPGEHRIELFKKGYRLWNDTVTVIVEQTASISSTLEKLPESIICVKVANMAGNAGQQLYAVNTEDGTARMIRDFGSSRMLSVFALKPTGDRIAVGSGGKILIIDQLGSDITSFDVGEKVPGARTKTQFTFEPEIHALDWHPTKNRLLVTYGVHIAYTLGGQSSHIGLCDLDTKKFIKLGGEDDAAAAFSPDGSKILFRHGSEIAIADNNLKSINVISKKLETSYETMTGTGYYYRAPFRWNPNGNSLLCCKAWSFTMFSDKIEAHVLSPDGEILHTVAGVYPGACWSPDGSSIASSITEDGKQWLAIIDPVSGDVRKLAEGFTGHLSWGTLAEVSNEPGELDVRSSTAGQKIILDEKLSGEITPHVFEVTPGSHSVQLQGPQGDYTQTRPVTVRPGKTTTVSF